MEGIIQLVVPALVPPIVDFVNKDVGSERLRFGASFVVSIVVGALIALPQLLQGTGQGNDRVFQVMIGVFTEAQIIYNLYWKSSKVRDMYQTRLAKPEDVVLETTPTMVVESPSISAPEAGGVPSEPSL